MANELVPETFNLQQEVALLTGGVPGTPVVRTFPFAYNTPDILTGAAVYIPTIGDILLDAWVEVDTAWNGTTPKGDVGPFPAAGSNLGWFRFAGVTAIDMTQIDDARPTETGLTTGPYVPSPTDLAVSVIQNNIATPLLRFVPAKFVTADPIKVCVSQDGKNNGADPGSTQGTGRLYLITATPV